MALVLFSFFNHQTPIRPQTPTADDAYGWPSQKRDKRPVDAPLSPRPLFLLIYWSGLVTSMACTTFLAHSSYTSTSERHASAPPASPFFSLCHAGEGYQG